jgi:hypothetical protein
MSKEQSNSIIKEGETYLITTSGWFIAPDGEQYRSVWGKCYIYTTEEILGFTPIRPSTNWFLNIGGMIIAGCQIHYIIKCESKPQVESNFYTDFDTKNNVGRIYISE